MGGTVEFTKCTLTCQYHGVPVEQGPVRGRQSDVYQIILESLTAENLICRWRQRYFAMMISGDLLVGSSSGRCWLTYQRGDGYSSNSFLKLWWSNHHISTWQVQVTGQEQIFERPNSQDSYSSSSYSTLETKCSATNRRGTK